MQKSMNFLDQNRLRSSHGSRHQPSHLKEFKELLNFQRSARHLSTSFDVFWPEHGHDAQETQCRGWKHRKHGNKVTYYLKMPIPKSQEICFLFCWGWAGDVHFLTQVLTFAVRLLSASRTNVAMVFGLLSVSKSNRRKAKPCLSSCAELVSAAAQPPGPTWKHLTALTALTECPSKFTTIIFQPLDFFTPGHLCVHLVTTCHLFSHPVLQLCVVESWLRAGWEQTIVRIDYEQTPNRHEYTTNRLGMVDQVDIKWRSSPLCAARCSHGKAHCWGHLPFSHFFTSQLRSFAASHSLCNLTTFFQLIGRRRLQQGLRQWPSQRAVLLHTLNISCTITLNISSLTSLCFC